MPLALDDPRWNALTTPYGLTGDDVREWLRTAYAGGMNSELLGNIINEVQHQGDTSQAMYAVAPHLLALAATSGDCMARDMVIHAGLIHASAQSPSAVPCPPGLENEFQTSAAVGLEKAISFLPVASEFDEFKYLVAAIAGFKGHGRFGRLIEGFDLFEGQFHHSSLDAPFPEES
jgi:hypothetical protein